MIPENEATIVGISTNTEIDGKAYYQETLGFVFHVHAVSVIIGQLFLSVFGAMGMIFLPYNLLNDWIFRPKQITKADFVKRQKILLPMILNLRKETKLLEVDRMQVALMASFTGYWRRF